MNVLGHTLSLPNARARNPGGWLSPSPKTQKGVSRVSRVSKVLPYCDCSGHGWRVEVCPDSKVCPKLHAQYNGGGESW